MKDYAVQGVPADNTATGSAGHPSWVARSSGAMEPMSLPLVSVVSAALLLALAIRLLHWVTGLIGQLVHVMAAAALVLVLLAGLLLFLLFSILSQLDL
jgi:hypothetical protein